MTTPHPDGAGQPTQLLGPTAEIDSGPEGPDVGAFFDLDGTLVAGYTAAAQMRDRLRRRDLRVVEFLTIVELAVQFRLGRRAFETLIEGSALTVKGRQAQVVDEMGERIFRQSVADLIYPEMREMVRAHQRRGHTVVLSSSALTNQVAPVARYLGIEHIVCNRLVADGQEVLTGDLEQPVIWGPTKASRVQQFAADHHVDLGSSYFYADGDEDLSLMYLVGHPRPTNPEPVLTKVAVSRGWPILRFSSRGGGGPLGVGRRLASASSVGLLAAVAVGVGLVRRNKRAGINVLTRFWPGTVLALSGVKLNVTGAEHLTERRPAVFLFNSRSNVDVFLVAALVKDNWTSVATKEIQDGRVFGQLGKLLDVAFVDREHPGAAALKPLEAAARNGLSILIAPERTRPDTQSVGPFKRTPFLIAMATGLPIVPIVIRNSESVAGTNTRRLNPGTVDIAVLPAVSVNDWTLRNMRDRVKQIRTAYLETLAEWPAGKPDPAGQSATEVDRPSPSAVRCAQAGPPIEPLAACGFAVLGDDAGRNAPALLDVNAVLPRPGTDGHGVNRAALTTCAGGATATSADLSGVGNVVRGWIIRHFIDPAQGVRSSKDVEIKWGIHPTGDKREEWTADDQRTTLVLLVQGNFRIDLTETSTGWSPAPWNARWRTSSPHSADPRRAGLDHPRRRGRQGRLPRPATTIRERKQLIRAVITEIILTVDQAQRTAQVTIV
jgi:putative phosphoserine phosphatase / 1-acylglycerol-3-phosphate O-acyltransferase